MRGRQPCGGTAIDTTPIAGPGGDLQLVAGESCVAEPQGGLCRGHAHGRRFRPPSETFEIVRDPFRPCGHLVVPRRFGGLGRDQCDEFGDRNPPGAAGGSEFLAGGHGLAVGSVRVVLGEAGPSEEQTRFGEVHHVADPFEGTDREFGVLARFGMQPGGDHQLTPIRRQHARAPAGIADLGVQRVGAGERRQRRGDVALQSGGECVVVGGASREEELPVVGGETLRDRGVREGFVDLAPVGEHDGSVAPQPRLEHTVVAPGDERERSGVCLERFGRTAQLLDHHGALHLEITAFFGRQLVTDRVGDGERFFGPSTRGDDRHEGAHQLRDTGAVVEFLADRDGRTEMVLGVRKSVEFTLGKGLGPESDQAGKTRDVLAVRGCRQAAFRDSDGEF